MDHGAINNKTILEVWKESGYSNRWLRFYIFPRSLKQLPEGITRLLWVVNSQKFSL